MAIIFTLTPDKNIVDLYHKRVISGIQKKANKGLNLINFIISEDFDFDVNNFIPKNYRILNRVEAFVEYDHYMLDNGFKYTIVKCENPTENPVKKVVEQITNMFQNNIVKGNGIESFEGWCEDGEVFGWNEPEISIMKELSPYVDSLTNKIAELLNS